MLKNISFFLSFILAIGLILGAIFFTNAYFSDRETSKGNSFKAGTLDLLLSQSASSSTSSLALQLSNMAPYQKKESFLAVKNRGGLPFEWDLSFKEKGTQPGIGGGALPEILHEAVFYEMGLLDYLNAAKLSQDKESCQSALKGFISKINFLKEENLISDIIAEDLITKAEGLQGSCGP